MKKLIPDEAIASATRLPKDNLIVSLLTRVARIDEVNDLYDSVCNSQGLETIEKLFKQLDLEIELDEKLLENIPAKGAFIVAANHPFGALDGLTMLYAIAKVRPDFKVMANFLLQNVEPIKDYFVSVNPFENKRDVYSNVTGLKSVMQHLENGHPLGMFPAGEVSTFQGDFRTIADKKWANSAVKIIRNAGVPVVPVYFDGTNSRIFHLLGLIHANLRTLALPSEMLKKKGKVIRMKIGKPIQPKDTEMFTNLEQYGRYIRAKTYALGSTFDVKRDYFKVFRTQKKADEIIPPVSQEDIIREVDAIVDFKTLSYDNFDCYVVGSSHIPKILREIGRLREVTFREVGEGTNKSIDLDEYDLYYNHLILWDREAKKIAGAYRVGNGYQIMNTYGRKGFYISSLFRISPQLDTMLSQSLELGRSFIVKEYQRHRLSLFLLWKGILYYLISNQQFRYIIGPVSISNQYQEVSKELIIEFITKNYFDHVLAEHVSPKNAFKPKMSNVDTSALVDSSQADLKKMDRIISDIEPTAFTMPVLLKNTYNRMRKLSHSIAIQNSITHWMD
ncbi:MAG: lysophospholipid acyltransferase family protein [Flavobacteriales bacterium]|nr:lysophospholipid acyltransferase family protein [Flavobacteriales bacterium]